MDEIKDNVDEIKEKNLLTKFDKEKSNSIKNELSIFIIMEVVILHKKN